MPCSTAERYTKGFNVDPGERGDLPQSTHDPELLSAPYVNREFPAHAIISPVLLSAIPAEMLRQKELPPATDAILLQVSSVSQYQDPCRISANA